MRNRVLAFVIGLYAALFALAGGIVVGSDAITCHAQYDGSVFPVRYSIWGGCQVKDPKLGWVPSSKIRITQ